MIKKKNNLYICSVNNSKKANSKHKVSTEERIKQAATKVFTQKGFAATRTRDIAEEAGINLALLNYYFRSKKKLFDQVMAAKFHEFFGSFSPILNNPASSLETKIKELLRFYTQMLIKNPDLPLFVLSEIKNNPKDFAQAVKIKEILSSSVFIKQVKEKQPQVNPLQIMLSILGMTVFPHIARPVFESSEGVSKEAYNAILLERETLVPKWIMTMFEIE